MDNALIKQNTQQLASNCKLILFQNDYAMLPIRTILSLLFDSHLLRQKFQKNTHLLAALQLLEKFIAPDAKRYFSGI